MENSLVANEHYVGLQGWMLNNLKLKGNELIVFAIIHGFSQGEQGVFNGSLQYLADWTNSTKQGVIKNIKSLIGKGFITKNEIKKGCIKYCEYSSKFNGGEQSLIVDETKFNGTVKQSLPNNIVNNIDKNNSIYIKQSLPDEVVKDLEKNKEKWIIDIGFESFWTKYPRHIAKQNAKKAYVSAIKNKKVTHEELISGLDKYIEHIKQEKTEERYIKHASTWLNGGCWSDEYKTESSKPQEKRPLTEEELMEFRRKRIKERQEKEELERQQLIESLKAQGAWIE